MKKEDFRVMENIALLVVLAVPCCLLFCYDSMFLMFLGAFYTWEYWSNVLRPIWKRYRATMEAQDDKM